VTDDEILSGIEEVAHRHLGWSGRLEGRQRLVEDLGLDSLQALTLAVEVENRFAVCLDPERDAELVTVSDLVQAVRRAGGT
jgi:acyl carrier protein